MSSISNHLLSLDTNRTYVDTVTVLSAATVYANSRSVSTLYAKYTYQCAICEKKKHAHRSAMQSTLLLDLLQTTAMISLCMHVFVCV